MDSSIIVLLVLIVFFLIGRELVCWYFKLNKISALLEEIRDELKNKK
jgi:uncharacterized membrane protein YqjE